MKFQRSCGVLLHPTSFSGPHGIGELGAEAYRFLDFMGRSGQRIWQIMPLGPTGFGDSPYQCFSAFAGNPLLISLDRLKREGFLDESDLADIPPFPPQKVDFGWVITWKAKILARAFQLWKERGSKEERVAFEKFRQENKGWLLDFALFMALKDAHGGSPWNHWPHELAIRDEKALDRAKEDHSDAVLRQSFYQFKFFQQWSALRWRAGELGIKIVGDIPIFIAYDSADAWSHRDLFHLDEDGNPTIVAGVPPDYFSVTGQRWGNPHYRWDVMAKNGYAWWVERFRQAFATVDIIRIDHFRGFEASWEVPASEETAVKGEWVKGPGIDLFNAVQDKLGTLPIIAEDLGLITPEVHALRKEAGFPGMRVLQFGFGSDEEDPFLPHNYVPETVVYTGTHDNDTSIGWYAAAPEKERAAFREYSGKISEDGSGEKVHEEMIRLATESVADTVVIPLQDWLGLGTEARMNMPGRADGNWGWRYDESVLSDELSNRMREIASRTGRIG